MKGRIEADREKSDDSEREEKKPLRTGNALTQLTTTNERKKRNAKLV